MRLATIRTSDGTRAARIDGEFVTLLEAPDVRALLETGDGWQHSVREARGPAVPVSDVSFAPLVPRPEKIFVLGWNYAEHVREGGAEMPQYPSLFAKYSRALIGAYDPIAVPSPAISTALDAEAELGVVIGRRVHRIDESAAHDAIAGYTIFNDTSVRDWQFRSPFPMQGKTWEHSTPVGPWFVTPDEVDHAADLRIQCLIDGAVAQDARTSDMIFGPAFLVSYLSTILTLDPGDLISMGTPSGVGFSHTPPRYLREGQTVTIRIEGIGELVNRCVAENAWAPAPAGQAVAR